MDAWEKAWVVLGGHAYRADGREELLEAISRASNGRGPILATAEPALADVSADLRWPECGITGAARAAVAVVGAVAAVAATGSIVVDSSAAGGRSASLLPDVVIFVFHQEDVVATPGDVLRAHRHRWPSGPPSQLVFVTGPSRSADIEMTLTVGVHGPGEVHAIALSP